MRLLFITLLLVFSLVLPPGNNAYAETEKNVQFKDITLTTSTTHLLLFGIIQNEDQEKLVLALHNGIPMEYTFFVKLFGVKEQWPDENLADIVYSHTLKYDALKEQYQLTLEEQKNRKLTFNDLTKALLVMNEINGLKVVEFSKLTPGTTYEIHIKADLFKKTLPMNLHYVIPFISLWDMDTNWHTIEFTY